MSGRKARCNKCGKTFRLPGKKRGAGSGGDSPSAVPELNPFDFSAPAPAPEPPKKTEPSPTAKKSATAPEKPAAKPRYRARSGGGVGRLILVVVLFGLVVGAVVGGVLLYLDSKKGQEAEHAAGEKKDEPTAPAPEPTTPAEPQPSAAKDAAKRSAKATRAVRGTAAGGRTLALPAGPPVQFAPPAAKPELIDKPEAVLSLQPQLPPRAEAAFPLARRVFPPLKRDVDPAVLWQTDPGFQGRGEKLLLGVFGTQSGRQVGKVEVDGDGQPDPACDLSADADRFAHANRAAGTVSVFNTRDGSKVIDGFAPYTGMKDKDYKLAAVYLTEPPDALVTVSTTGAVHAWKVPTKEPLGEYVPAKPAGKPLVPGKSVAPGPGKQSVVLVAAGAVYAVAVKPGVKGDIVADLGGDAGRSLALAVSGGGRVVYAFETDAEGRKETAVVELRDDGKHTVLKWPAKDAGEPVTAGWVGDDLAMVGTDRGAAAWFEAEGSTFRPLALARTPGDMARHVAADGHWALLPDPADRKRCLLVEFSRPQQALVNPLERPAKPITVRLDEKGLHK
jgi:hypothetical protein